MLTKTVTKIRPNDGETKTKIREVFVDILSLLFVSRS